MDLFSNPDQNFLREEFHSSWYDELSNFINNDFAFGEMIKNLDKEREDKTIYPEKEDVFKIFKLLPLENVKVVILGQDPYFNGNADGIAFSCKRDWSPSLKQILFAMNKDVKPVNPSPQMNLKYLVEQGVFLYNPILTVEEGKPLSHERIGWHEFTLRVFAALNRVDNLVWLLWGAKAQEYNSRSYNLTHLVLRAEHPAAAARNNRIWTVDHFSKVNEILKQKGLKEINWLKTKQ